MSRGIESRIARIEHKLDANIRDRHRFEIRITRAIARIEGALGTAATTVVVPSRKGFAIAAGAGGAGAGIVAGILAALQAGGLL